MGVNIYVHDQEIKKISSWASKRIDQEVFNNKRKRHLSHIIFIEMQNCKEFCDFKNHYCCKIV